MSGPYDRPDDPDEVTLWAGRLRSWPTPAPAEDDELADETVLSRRDTPDDDTVRSAADVPEDETFVSRRTPGEESSASRVDLADEATVVLRREATVEESSASRVELPDDATVVSRREAPVEELSALPVELPDDETIVSRAELSVEDVARSLGISHREVLDDATIASPPARSALPGRAGPADDEVGTTAPRRAATAPPLDAAVPDGCHGRTAGQLSANQIWYIR